MAAPEAGSRGPEEYDGSNIPFFQFATKVRFYLALNPNRFPTEDLRVKFIVTLLTGLTFAWATSFLKTNDPVIHSVEAFLGAMERQYDSPRMAQYVANQLSAMRQRSDLVTTYATKFRELAVHLNWAKRP